MCLKVRPSTWLPVRTLIASPTMLLSSTTGSTCTAPEFNAVNKLVLCVGLCELSRRRVFVHLNHWRA